MSKKSNSCVSLSAEELNEYFTFVSHNDITFSLSKDNTSFLTSHKFEEKVLTIDHYLRKLKNTMAAQMVCPFGFLEATLFLSPLLLSIC